MTTRTLGEVFNILQGNVGMGTTIPRKKLDIHSGDLIVNQRIGINTSNPEYNLHVVGNTNITDTLSTSNVFVMGSLEFTTDANTFRKRIQINPIRQITYVNEASNDTFILTTDGIYGGHASNAQVFYGQTMLSYYTPTIKDYDMTIQYTDEPPTTSYVIKLVEYVKYGSVIDIIVWPQLVQQSTPVEGQVYQQVKLFIAEPWKFTGETQVYLDPVYTLGIGTQAPRKEVDIIGDLIVSGNVGIGTTYPRLKFDLTAIDAFPLPSGSNIDRPFGRDGYMRYNTETQDFEGYTENNWRSLSDLYWTSTGNDVHLIPNGNVGIGINIPTHKLDVQGDIGATFIYTSNIRILNGFNSKIQLPPIRYTTYIEESTIDTLILSMNGIYGATASNVQLFVNDALYFYYSSNVKDYDLTYQYNLSLNKTTFTVTTEQYLPNGSLIDLVLWPQLVPLSDETSIQFNQTIELTDTFFRPINTTDVFLMGNVGIGTSNVSEAKLMVGGHLFPSSNVAYDLGSSNYRWRDIYLSGNTINLGETTISRDTSTGGIKVLSETGIDIDFTARNIFTSGNIGIGTSNIELGRLVVDGSVIPNLNKVYDLGGSNLRWRDLYLSGNTIDLDGTQLQKNNTTNGLQIVNSQNSNQFLSFHAHHMMAGGNIGIGTIMPRYPLDVIGNIHISGKVATSEISGVSSSSIRITSVTSNLQQVYIENNNSGPAIKVVQGGGDQSIAEFYDKETGIALMLTNDGRLGIGTDVVTDKMNVNGTIQATNLTIGNVTNAYMPRGGIILWSGSIATIPIGWLLCDGTGGTPNLRDRFVVGAGSTYAVAATGGALTVTLVAANLPPHAHSGTTDGVGNHSHTASSTGSGGHTHTTTIGTWGRGDWSNWGGGNTIAWTGVNGNKVNWNPSYGTDNPGNHTHTITVDAGGAHSHTFTTGNGPGTSTSFSILPPYYALAYIMKA